MNPGNVWNCTCRILQSSACFAFLNILTVRTPFPYVPEAFQQWEQPSHAFPIEMTPDEY